jgi:hypothetical protein
VMVEGERVVTARPSNHALEWLTALLQPVAERLPSSSDLLTINERREMLAMSNSERSLGRWLVLLLVIAVEVCRPETVENRLGRDISLVSVGVNDDRWGDAQARYALDLLPGRVLTPGKERLEVVGPERRLLVSRQRV